MKDFLLGFFFGAVFVTIIALVLAIRADRIKCENKGGVYFADRCLKVEVLK